MITIIIAIIKMMAISFQTSFSGQILIAIDLGVVVVVHRRIDDVRENVSNDKRYIIFVAIEIRHGC